MSNRIEELYAQSFTDHQGEQFDPEQFAKLIIEECAEQYHQTRPIEMSFKQKLLKHFGVK